MPLLFAEAGGQGECVHGSAYDVQLLAIPLR